jgi:hypothetical protein
LGKEDFITLLTSCIICLVKGEPQVVDHLLAWGFVHSLCDLLKRCIDGGRVGAPATCIIRILHQLVSKVETVDNLACANNDVIGLLTRALGQPGSLNKESAYIVELLKKIFQSVMCRSLGYFVQAAMSCKLPSFLLDNIIGASNDALKDVRNAGALRIHAVDLIKAIMAADDGNAVGLQALVDLHHAWSEFRDQSHDLFITVRCYYSWLPPSVLVLTVSLCSCLGSRKDRCFPYHRCLGCSLHESPYYRWICRVQYFTVFYLDNDSNFY